MNSTVQNAITAGLAELVRIEPTPTAPYGFGRDLSCVTDVTETLAEVLPDSPLGIAQAAARRLTTARGTLPDDPGYGIDVRGFLNRGLTFAELRAAEGQARNELVQDDRILAVELVFVASEDGSALTIAATITPEDPGLATFEMILAVTSSAVILEAIQ